MYTHISTYLLPNAINANIFHLIKYMWGKRCNDSSLHKLVLANSSVENSYVEKQLYLKLGLLVFGRLPTTSSRGLVTSLIGGRGSRGLSRGLSLDTVPGISSPKKLQ